MKNINLNKIIMLIFTLSVVFFLWWYTASQVFALCNSGRMKLYFGVIFFLLVFSLGLYVCLLWRDKMIKPERMAVIMVLIWGTIFGLVLPEGSAPDEYIHFASAYEWSNRLMGTSEYDNEQTIVMRNEDIESEEDLQRHKYPSLQGYAEIANGNYFGADSELNVGIQYWINPFYKFIPSTIGITVARLVHLGKYGLRFLGRFLNLCFYALCAWGAVKITPIGKYQIVSFSMIPMMIELYSSYSYDAISNGVALLYISCCLRLYSKKESIQWYEYVITLLLYAYLLPFKGVYAGFILLLFLGPIPLRNYIHRRKNRTKRNRWRATTEVVLLIGFGVCMVYYIAKKVFNLVVAMSRGITLTNECNEIIHTYGLADLFLQPRHMLDIIFNTLNQRMADVFFELFGRQLGWLEIGASDVAIMGIISIIIASFLMESHKAKSGRFHFLVWTSIILMAVMIILGPLFTWTDVSEPTIHGIQGRYFLPGLALVMICFGSEEQMITQRQMRLLYLQNIMLVFVIQSVLYITVNR